MVFVKDSFFACLVYIGWRFGWFSNWYIRDFNEEGGLGMLPVMGVLNVSFLLRECEKLEKFVCVSCSVVSRGQGALSRSLMVARLCLILPNLLLHFSRVSPKW